MTNERTIKHQRVVQYLDARKLDGVLLSRRCNFTWYSCGAHTHVSNACDSGGSYLLVTRKDASLIANTIEAPRLTQEELPGIELHEFGWHTSTADAINAAIGKARVAADVVPAGVNVQPLGGDFDALRYELTSDEVARYKALCRDTVTAIEAAARAAKPGMTENEIAGRLDLELRKFNLLPWVTLIGVDDRIDRFRHPLPTAKKLEKRLLMVTCSERSGMISNFSRLVSFGKLSDDLARKQQACANVDTALITSTVVGAKMSDIFAQAQAAYAAGGFGEQWKLHHQGGPCGYLPRDFVASPTCDARAVASQAFAWNPSITGTKSEDTVLCTAAGPEMMVAPTDWPTVRGEWKDKSLERPAILVL